MSARQPSHSEADRGRVHVAVAAVVNAHSQVLMTRRHPNAHLGGLWEFPGGKVEPREAIRDALCRELHEEVGIRPLRMRPLIRIAHDYPDKRVLLDTWRVDQFSGAPSAREGQPLRWVAIDDLPALALPAANRGIVTALRLAARLLITPEPAPGHDDGFLHSLALSIRRRRLAMVQLRAKQLAEQQYVALAHEALQVCDALGATLILNGEPRLLQQVDAGGLHLPAARVAHFTQRPIGMDKYLSIAVHDAREIESARRLQPDFVLLSPVKHTASHPDAAPLGWRNFAALARSLDVPVFALGGMRSRDVETARRNGAQGIAAIGALWCPVR